MLIKYNKKLIPKAQTLRKNMTDEEKHLWYDFLITYPVKFHRQIVFGKYITDFYCAKAKLVIELDGSQHFEEKGMESDKSRTEYLERYKVTVIRIPNNYIKNRFSDVCEYIDSCVKTRMLNKQ